MNVSLGKNNFEKTVDFLAFFQVSFVFCSKTLRKKGYEMTNGNDALLCKKLGGGKKRFKTSKTSSIRNVIVSVAL